MLLKGLKLDNIRSYGDEGTSIDLLPGLTLFEGDIGSGKSTILSAIEFGLFGLGDVEAKHLLRHGAKKGRVEVKFEAAGKEYSVSRSLSKSGRGIQQEECSLVGGGVSGSYSPSELKPLVLEILGFNEKPDTKSTSRIFRYAVYTPQESMKEVLSMGEEQRLDTLRRAFGIERYSWAVANVEDAVLREWLNVRLKVLEEAISDLPKKRSELEEERQSIASLEVERSALARDEEEAEGAYEDIKEIITKLDPKRIEVAKLRSEIPLLEKDIRDSERRVARSAEDASACEKELSEASEAAVALEAIAPEYDGYMALKGRLAELQTVADERADLDAEAQRLSGQILVERRVLEKDEASLQKEVADADAVQGALSDAEESMRSLAASRADLEAKMKSSEEAEGRLKESERQTANLGAERDSINRELQKAETEWADIEHIGIGAPCPLCKAELTEDHFGKVREEYGSRISSLKASLDAVIGRLDLSASMLKEGEGEVAALQAARGEAKKLDIDLVRAEGALKELRDRARRVDEAADELAGKRRLLSEEGFARAERESLRKVESSLAAIKPRIDEFEASKEKLASLDGRQIPAQHARLSVLASKKAKLEGQLAKLREEHQELEARLGEKRDDLMARKARLAEDEPALVELEDVEGRRVQAEKRLSEVTKKLAAAKATIKESEVRADALAEEVRAMEEKQRERSKDDQTRRWLKELFVPSVSAMERQVLASVNETFNIRFQEWFSELMEAGDISVRVDESFTPVIEQDGYEIDAASLSGGERTSLALAYRLALNTMVKQQSTLEGGLLILDEPTDGFSSAQLLRLRDVLQETGCEQIIMVSHEKELESFVDSIYQVSKANGRSIVTKVSR